MGRRCRGAAGSVSPPPPPASREERTPISPVSPTDLQRLRELASTRPLSALSVSCCDGIASVAAAWRGLPVGLISVIAEIDEQALAVSQHRCKDAHFVGDLRNLTADSITEFISLYKPDFIFVSAGTPCKQLSVAAVDQAGLHGRDSRLFWDFRDVLVAASYAGSKAKLPCFFLWENVIMRDQWLLQAEAALGFQAVLVDAAYFGHHRRPRIWISNWQLQGEAAKWLVPGPTGRQEVQIPYSARRLPDLGRIFRSSFFPRRLRGAGTRDFPEGKFPCLTCPLRPGMRPWGEERASMMALQRSEQDGGIYQPYHYEDSVLLWAQEQFRRPCADEWDQLFGFPAGWTDVPGLPRDPRARELARQRLLGNAWHVPCARFWLTSLLIFLGVPAVDAKLDSCFVLSVRPADPQPAHSLFDLSGLEFVREYLRNVPAPLGPLAMQHLDLFTAPQHCDFLCWAIDKGYHKSGFFLSTLQEHARPGVNAAAAARQHGAHTSAFGMPRVVPAGLSPQEHFMQASELKVHPLDTPHDLPVELEWALSESTADPGQVRARRKARLKWLSDRAKAFKVLNLQAVQAMTNRVRAVAGNINVGLWLFFSVWCAWPDYTMAARLVTGFRVAELIESPPIFRQLPHVTPSVPPSAVLAQAAVHVDQLERRGCGHRDPAADAAVHKLVKKDLAKGFMRPGYDRQAMDSKYGRGKWLPLPRFAIMQGTDEDGLPKYRAIDDGAAAQTNSLVSTEIKVHTYVLSRHSRQHRQAHARGLVGEFGFSASAGHRRGRC